MKREVKSENKKKLKRKISIITLFLWIFLVATMIAIVTGNIKNTNALENDEEITNFPEAPNYNNIYMGGIHIFCDCGNHDFNNGDEYGEYLCYVSELGEGWDLNSEYVPFEKLFIMGDIIEDEGIYKCECKVNFDYLIDMFNKNNGKKHYKRNFYEPYYIDECYHYELELYGSKKITLVSDGRGWIFWDEREFDITDFSISLSEYNRAYYDKVRLIYDGNGGENVPEIDIKEALDYNGTEFTISSIEPTKNNYKFMGWSDEKDSGEVNYKPGQKITLVEDKTIYAVWEEVSTDIPTKKYGSYKVIHEYYTKDKDGNITLEDKVKSDVVTNVEIGKKVGIPGNGTVDIEVSKKLVHKENGVEYIYEYLENSGNIIIEENVEKEITIKYVREVSEEEDKKDLENGNINNSIENNVDTSDINIFTYIAIFIIAIVIIVVIIVYINRKNKSNK